MENIINFPTPELDERGKRLFDEAKKKLDDGVKLKLDRYGEAMKAAVHSALLDFCQQDNEFAEAVAQGGTFKDCMAAIAKNVKNGAISDIEAYATAVKFFFPGAGIDVRMTINLADSVDNEPSTPEAKEPPKKKGPVMVSLNDFFDV